MFEVGPLVELDLEPRRFECDPLFELASGECDDAPTDCDGKFDDVPRKLRPNFAANFDFPLVPKFVALIGFGFEVDRAVSRCSFERTPETLMGKLDGNVKKNLD